MIVETQEDIDKLKKDITELYESWMEEIIQKGNEMKLAGYEGDAHMYLLRVYASAGATLRNALAQQCGGLHDINAGKMNEDG